jgi:predicted acylesterase/phospholipase RssA
LTVVLSKGPAIDAILASAAIPGIFPLVHIDGQTLMDGAIARNSSIRVAADLGASRIVVLPTGYACSLNEPPKGAIAKALHAITLLIEWRLIDDVERLADAIDVCVVPALCPLDVSPYDFSASRYLMQRAGRVRENGSMAAAFRGDPGLPNVRRTAIEWHTKLPGMMARRFAAGTELAPRLPRRSWPGFRGWDRRGFRQVVMNLSVSRTEALAALTPSDASQFFQNKK